MTRFFEFRLYVVSPSLRVSFSFREMRSDEAICLAEVDKHSEMGEEFNSVLS